MTFAESINKTRWDMAMGAAIARSRDGWACFNCGMSERDNDITIRVGNESRCLPPDEAKGETYAHTFVSTEPLPEFGEQRDYVAYPGASFVQEYIQCTCPSCRYPGHWVGASRRED